MTNRLPATSHGVFVLQAQVFGIVNSQPPVEPQQDQSEEQVAKIWAVDDAMSLPPARQIIITIRLQKSRRSTFNTRSVREMLLTCHRLH